MKKYFNKVILINYILLLILPLIPLYFWMDITFQNWYNFDMRFDFINYIFCITGFIWNIILFIISFSSLWISNIQIILSICVILFALILKYFIVIFYVKKIDNKLNKFKKHLLILSITFLLSIYTTFIWYKTWMYFWLMWV